MGGTGKRRHTPPGLEQRIRPLQRKGAVPGVQGLRALRMIAQGLRAFESTHGCAAYWVETHEGPYPLSTNTGKSLVRRGFVSRTSVGEGKSELHITKAGQAALTVTDGWDLD